jgi:hypothetical protein
MALLQFAKYNGLLVIRPSGAGDCAVSSQQVYAL